MHQPAVATLRRSSLFAGLDERQLARLIDRLHVEEVPAGTVITREGDHGSRLWCLEEGEVAVRCGAVEITRLGAGATIGEMELIDLQPRSATVVALTPCRLLGLDLADILALQREDLPAFTLVVMNLARDLSRRLRGMDLAASRRDGRT